MIFSQISIYSEMHPKNYHEMLFLKTKCNWIKIFILKILKQNYGNNVKLMTQLTQNSLRLIQRLQRKPWEELLIYLIFLWYKIINPLPSAPSI